MQIQALYQNGGLIFRRPKQLKGACAEVEVTIPEGQKEGEELTPANVQPPQGMSPLREQLNALAGRYAKKRPAVASGADKAAWRQHLYEKYLEKR